MLSARENIENVIEAILFVSGQGVEIGDIAEKLEVEESEVKNAILRLKEKKKDSGINILTYKNSVQLCSNPDYAEDISTVLNPIREKQLTKATLETLAIIAYKQPITRLDIEDIRGVNSDYAVQILMNFNLIEVVGRKDAVGKPLLFGTTDEFLKRFNLQDVNELPDYDELLERIAVLHKEFNDGLYRSTEIIPEEQLVDEETTDIFNDKMQDNSSTSNNNEPKQDNDASIESNDIQNKTFEEISNQNNVEISQNENSETSEEKIKETLLSKLNDYDDDDDFYEKDSDLL